MSRGLALAAFLVWALSTYPVKAFQQLPTVPARTDREGLVPASDRDAEAWLRRADEAAAQGDWKLAADTLMRIVDQYGDRTVGIDDGQHYLSAIRAAQDAIGRLPPEGLETYHQLFDAEARQLLESARKARDTAALRQVVRRFPHTSTGAEAANLLSAWLIDRGECGEAIDLLEQMLERHINQNTSRKALQKLIVAYTLDGQKPAAQRLLEELRKSATSGPADRDSESHSRLESLAKFIDRPQSTTNDSPKFSGAAPWPQLLGPPALMGRMPAIDPAVAPDTAQYDELQGAARTNPAVALRVMASTGRPPVWQMVSDGKSIFVTCAEGLIARDLGSFELLWKSIPKRPPRDPRIERHRFMTGQIEIDNSDRLDESTTQSLYHEYRGAVSTALGMVFAIEQGATTNETFPDRNGVIGPNNIFRGDDFSEPNSLRAFDALSGKSLWTKGRGGPVEDNLRYAHFFAPPVIVGKQLVAPLHVGADLQLARISPDGKLLGTILLGTGQPGMFPMNSSLPLTLHEGTLYVPTGAGMFIALTAYDLSLRWQTPYLRSQLAISQGTAARQIGPGGLMLGGLSQVDEWLVSPPLVVGSLVILAPNDSEWLLAFDRRSGALKWQFPRGDHRYLVAADAQHVFIAGKTVRAVDVQTGLASWSFEMPAYHPLGRPALSGDMLLVPTESHLIRLNAATGEMIGEPMAVDHALGNLLVIDGSLYSVSTQRISRFPDIEAGRVIATATLAKNPDDQQSLVRMAQLSAIRRNWREALGYFDRADPENGADHSVVPGSGPKSQASVLERTRHQHIQALLNLAAQSSVAEQVPLLERAVRFAVRPNDQVSAGLAMCDLKKEQGDLQGALQTALKLAATHGDEPFAPEPDLTVTTTVLVAERIESIFRAAAKRDSDNGGLQKTIGAMVHDDLSGLAQDNSAPQIDRLVQMSDALNGAGGVELDSRLGKFFEDSGDRTTAGFFVQRAERHASSASAKDALFNDELRLAISMALPGAELPITQPGRAGRTIESIQARATKAPLPGDLPEPARKLGAKSMTELLARLQEKLPGPLRGGRAQPLQVLNSAKELDLVLEDSIPPPTSQIAPDVRSYSDPAHPFDPYTSVVPIRLMRQFKGVQTGGPPHRGPFWSTVVNTVLEDERSQSKAPLELVAHAAACIGDMAVLDAGSQVCAIDIPTGEMLWPPIAVDRSQGQLPEPPLLAVGSNVVIAVDPTTLVAAPARSNADPTWRRRWPHRLRLLSEVDGALIVVDGESYQVSVVDPASGRVRRQYTLDIKGLKSGTPMEANGEWVPPLAVVGRVICFSSKAGLSGRDAATGQLLWEHPEPAVVIDVRRLDADHVGVSLPNMILDVVAVDTGTTVRQFTLEGALMPPVEMSLDWHPLSGSAPAIDHGGLQPMSGPAAGRLTVFCKSNGDPAQFFIHSLPLDGAENSWRHELGRYASINSQMIHASPDYLAAVRYLAKEDARQPEGAPIDKTVVTVFDKVTGRELIQPFEITSRRITRKSEGTKLIKDVIITNERIIAVSPDAYYVLAQSDRPRPKNAEADGDERESR